MNVDDPCPGGAMLIASGPSGGDHLFIIVTKRCRDNRHLLVSISSIREGRAYDPACVLDAGDHPFVHHPSYVVYAKPEERPAGFITNMLTKGAYRIQDDVHPAVLERVCDGMSRSEFGRPWAIKYFQANAPF
jgi:hypothetical protein